MTTVDFASHPVMIPVNISTIGDNVIITGIPNNWIYVHQILLNADGGNNQITIKKGATVLSIIPLQQDMGVILENTRPDYPYLFDVEPNLNLIFTLSAGTSVKGHVIYSLRK